MLPAAYNAFLLTYSCRDYSGRFEITLFAKSKTGEILKIVVDDFLPPFFVQRDMPAHLTVGVFRRTSLDLMSMDGTPVDCCYFRTWSAFQQCARDIRSAGFKPLESDVHPADRFLMERQVCGGLRAEGPAVIKNGMVEMRNPRIRGFDTNVAFDVMSIDIETNAATDEIYCIGCAGKNQKVFMCGSGTDDDMIIFCGSEKTVLQKFMAHLAAESPDIIIGWNVIEFDLAIIQKRCAINSVPFEPGRQPGARLVVSGEESVRHIVRFPGRTVLDVPVMLRAWNNVFDEYSLDYVASHLLGRHKDIEAAGQAKIDEINRLYINDRRSLALYNIKDAVLTKEIFDKANILPNAVERSKRSGHLLDRAGGSVAAFDYLYLPLLHRRGYVARDVVDAPPPPGPLPGGWVMDSAPGIYENVLLFDFKSLYPTIIMTFLIDPLGADVNGGERIKGPAGPSFSKSESILPGIISDLLKARSEAKKTGNSSLSQAIKILMNSFYGVLGTTGCRFFSFELASAITGTGQYILKTTKAHIEESTGNKVIYGDTDSLFVLLGPGSEKTASSTGREIVAETNLWLAKHLEENFGAVSALELEFEMHFRHFFMPTIRGSQQGSKKRYCGAVETKEGLSLIFKGLESARSDWTPLAKNFQHELFMRVFTGQPVEEYVAKTISDVRKGNLDSELVYRKGVRKKLDQYTDHVPPHIQAARMLKGRTPSRVSYVITTSGPQPVGMVTSPLDYEHYVETQIRPIAESILEWKGIKIEEILTGQQNLFV
jgi:DNA polymerase-2